MTLLQQLSSPESWEVFYEYKTSLICPKGTAESLRSFIDDRRYLPVRGALSAAQKGRAQ